LRPEWPEGGGVWEEEGMDCGLQAMAEEDEDINFYNDETFGMGWLMCLDVLKVQVHACVTHSIIMYTLL